MPTATINSTFARNEKQCTCNVCVHKMNMQIVLFVMVSRNACHHDNISNTLADQLQF